MSFLIWVLLVWASGVKSCRGLELMNLMKLLHFESSDLKPGLELYCGGKTKLVKVQTFFFLISKESTNIFINNKAKPTRLKPNTKNHKSQNTTGDSQPPLVSGHHRTMLPLLPPKTCLPTADVNKMPPSNHNNHFIAQPLNIVAPPQTRKTRPLKPPQSQDPKHCLTTATHKS